MPCKPVAEEDGWLLVLEGWKGSGPLLVDGELVQAQELPALQGVRRLYDTEGNAFELRAGPAHRRGAAGPGAAHRRHRRPAGLAG